MLVDTRRLVTVAGTAAFVVIALATHGFARTASGIQRAFAANVIVPQSRSFLISDSALPTTGARRVAVEVTGVTAGVVIIEQVATTTLDISLRNMTGSRQEAELVVPVPEGAAVRGQRADGRAPAQGRSAQDIRLHSREGPRPRAS